mmetsp:Transcript_5855/g.14116  ORF Transcript_5855/g.14116 Transcript_5855/m.14116 type:complete len:264 (-) Transcript_5855:419-1210(-)
MGRQLRDGATGTRYGYRSRRGCRCGRCQQGKRQGKVTAAQGRRCKTGRHVRCCGKFGSGCDGRHCRLDCWRTLWVGLFAGRFDEWGWRHGLGGTRCCGHPGRCTRQRRCRRSCRGHGGRYSGRKGVPKRHGRRRTPKIEVFHRFRRPQELYWPHGNNSRSSCGSCRIGTHVRDGRRVRVARRWPGKHWQQGIRFPRRKLQGRRRPFGRNSRKTKIQGGRFLQEPGIGNRHGCQGTIGGRPHRFRLCRNARRKTRRIRFGRRRR